MRRLGVALAVLLMGCGLWGNPLDRFRATTVNVPPPDPPAVVDDEEHLPWAANDEYFVVVRRACRTLDLYRFGERIRNFPAVFGLGGIGRKLYAGDFLTPTGLYMIVDKRPHPRWQYFLLLDYPNLEDLHRYWLAMEAGRVPQRGDHYAGVGGLIGIHGTDKPQLNSHGIDWTLGCISIDSDAIDDLAELVPVGTLVLIED